MNIDYSNIGHISRTWGMVLDNPFLEHCFVMVRMHMYFEILSYLYENTKK